MLKSKVLFLMTGSIACYKACHVISRLVQANCEVQVVASQSALQFIGAATLEGLSGKAPLVDMYASGNMMEHIHLMRWADLILVAPATANFINKTAQGFGDDFLSTLFLAHDFKRPFLVAPAMNSSMYTHPITQRSIQTLREMGIKILDTDSGILACGEEGLGRLIEPDLLTKKVLDTLKNSTPKIKSDTESVAGLPKSATRTKVLVTTGGTQEPIDTVRVLSNLSSGRTGIAIAEALVQMGFDVTLIQSHNSQKSKELPSSEVFTSFKSLDDKIKRQLSENEFSHIIHTAAVSDYSVSSIEIEGQKFNPLEVKKMSSNAETMSIHLTRNFKIVDRLKEYSKNKDIKVVAFKLTSDASEEQRLTAVDKLFENSNAALVVHNDLTEIDIFKKTHKFTIHLKNFEQPESKLVQKKLICENVEQLTNNLIQFLISNNIQENSL